MTRVLASIDASSYATSICDHAAWMAMREAGSVEILHVIDRAENGARRADLTGSIGLGAKSALLEELTQADEAQARLAQEHGRALLEGARVRLQAAGVAQVTLVHRHGEVAETVIALEADADLVVIGKRGESGNYSPGHLGSKVERVVRGSTRPVLVVPRVYLPLTRVLVAFDAGPSATRALEHIARHAAFENLDCHVVIVCDNGAEAGRRGDLARQILADRGQATIAILEGAAEAAILSELRHNAGDLLVMGAYGHSRIRELIIGSTTTTLIRDAKTPVLLFR